MKFFRKHIFLVFVFGVIFLTGCSVQHDVSRKEQSWTITFGSCVQEGDSAIWEVVQAKRPDSTFLLGDNVYLQGKELAGHKEAIRRRYELIWGKGTKARQLIENAPVFAIWDDHDLGPNDVDSTYEHLSLTKKMFQNFWYPDVPFDLPLVFKTDLVTVIATDNRSNRVRREGGRDTIFGKVQLDHLEKMVKEVTTPFLLLVSGGQVLSSRGDHEGLHQAKAEQERLLEILSETSAEVLIISGDMHHAEVLKRELPSGRQLYEFTSSPLAAAVRPSEMIRDEPYREFLYAAGPNFGLLTFRHTGAKLYEAEISLHDEEGKERFRLIRSNAP